MAGQLTWYDILEISPDSSADDVQRAVEEKAGILGPELLSGAATKVVVAADRARATLETGRQILTDPASRQRYDEETGIRRTGGGLGSPQPVSPDAWAWNARGGMDAGFVMDTLGEVVADWLAPHPAPPRHVTVPDVRGLFAGPCRRLIGARGLHVEVVRLVQNPMPVEGLVVDQSPPPGGSVRRSGTVTVQVWHPSRQTA
jgi:PASTA domain